MKSKKILRIIVCVILIAVLFVCQIAYADYVEYKKLLQDLCSQEIQLTVWDKYDCNDLLTGSKYDANELSWEADNDILRLEGNNFLCLSSGECVIKAKKGDDIVAVCNVDVAAQSIILLENDFVVIGEGLTFDMGARTSGGYQTVLEYQSENDTVAQVDDNGVVTALKSGSARIQVSGYGCDSVFLDVSVSDAPRSITLSTKKIMLGVGQNEIITASLPEGTYKGTALKYTSSDESVAVVDNSGNISAIGTGECEITVSAYSGATAVCHVSVGEAPTGLTAKLKKSSIFAGETVVVQTEVNKGAYCSGFTFTSSDPSVAEVSSEGVITGKGRGKAEITVTAYNGQKDTCSVSVRIFDYMTPPVSQDIYDAVGYLDEFYGDLISAEVIGSSVKGKDILLMKVGKGDKKACIVAGVHAKEDIAVAFTMRSIEEYAAAYFSKSGKYGEYDIKEMLDEYTLYVVPLLNPDGLDIVNAGEMPLYTDSLSDKTRKKYKNNANGVNLNRNFPFRWDQIIYSPTEPNESSSKGEYENSEPETQIIVKLVEENDFEWLFSMHCKGHFVYWSDKYNKITDKDRVIARNLRSECGYSLCDATPLKNLGGGLENWFRYKTGNPGFCIELVPLDRIDEVSKDFDKNVRWSMTKYTFAQGMRQ